MNINPKHSQPERHRDNSAIYDSQPSASDSSRSSTPSDSESPPHSSRLTTPRPKQDETQSAAALALLGLSMRTSSEAPSIDDQSPSPAQPLGGVSMKVTLSSASESASSSTDSTGSTRMSSMKKRRSSDSSGRTEDTGRSKRTRGSVESNEGPPTPKAKTDGWTDEMKRVYEQAAFALPPSGREQRRLFGDMRGRNEQLGLWVTLEIGTYCGRKRISSHSQTLKNHHSTNPELKKFLTTDSSCNPTSPSDPTAWPLRLKQLVHAAYMSLPNPPPLVSAAELDLANIAIPAIPVRILRKDGIEVEMTLPDAIEYDKADQRMKNREKKPMRGRLNKKSRTGTPSHAQMGQIGGGGRPYYHGRSPSSSMGYSPDPSNHTRAHSNHVHREVDRHTRYRQYSHTNADLPPYHNNPTNSHNYPGEVTGPSIIRPMHSSSAPVYWDVKSRSPRHDSSHSHHPPQSSSYPLPTAPLSSRNSHREARYDHHDPRDHNDGRHPEEEIDDEEARPRQLHPPSLDFILAKPISKPTPTPSPTTSTSTSKRTFWKS